MAPNTVAKYFSQQLRWRRSNVVDYLGGLSHVWRLHPLLAIHYISMAVVLVGTFSTWLHTGTRERSSYELLAVVDLNAVAAFGLRRVPRREPKWWLGERGLRVRATPMALSQILSTLVENALAHGRGTVDIAARRAGPRLSRSQARRGPAARGTTGRRFDAQ